MADQENADALERPLSHHAQRQINGHRGPRANDPGERVPKNWEKFVETLRRYHAALEAMKQRAAGVVNVLQLGLDPS